MGKGVETSEEMHATKTEPVLRWQTKEELQRWKIRVDEKEQKRRNGVDNDGKRGRKREGGIQYDGIREKIKLEANEGKHRRVTTCEGQMKEPGEVNIKIEERGVRESTANLIPKGQEKGKWDAKKSERGKSLEFGSPVLNATQEIAEAVKEKNNS